MTRIHFIFAEIRDQAVSITTTNFTLVIVKVIVLFTNAKSVDTDFPHCDWRRRRNGIFASFNKSHKSVKVRVCRPIAGGGQTKLVLRACEDPLFHDLNVQPDLNQYEVAHNVTHFKNDFNGFTPAVKKQRTMSVTQKKGLDSFGK
jgi:hypothetical protein